MKHNRNLKLIEAGVFFLLLVSTVGSIGITDEKVRYQPLALEYEPKSHDFGNMTQSQIKSTIFEIWRGGGCCELTFNLTWNYTWVTVFPTSGVSNGERVPVTVTVDTTGLENGFYSCDILITSNYGNGIFNVTLMVVQATQPLLAYHPQSYNFGTLAQNQIKSTDFDIWNSGIGTLNYTLTCNDSWVTVSPEIGSSTGEHDSITVTIDTTGLIINTTYTSPIQIQSNGGNATFEISVTIGTIPIFEIVSIKGGLFRLKAVIKNNGTADATRVEWKITFGGDGLILFGKETYGIIPNLAIGTEQTISTTLILGFGNVTATITIRNSAAAPLTKTISARLFLFYIKI